MCVCVFVCVSEYTLRVSNGRTIQVQFPSDRYWYWLLKHALCNQPDLSWKKALPSLLVVAKCACGHVHVCVCSVHLYVTCCHVHVCVFCAFVCDVLSCACVCVLCICM